MPTWNRFAPVSSVTYKGSRYAANGVDNPVIWDGVESGNAYTMGELAPSAIPTLATDGLTPGTLAGTYRYRYTYYRTATDDMPEYESGPSGVSADYTVAGTEGINVTFTDPGASLGFDSVRIYRQGGSLNQWYFVASAATGTAPYDDQAADTSIASNAVLNFRARFSADSYPPLFAFLVEQDGRLVGAGASGQEDRVYVSEPFPRQEHFLPEAWVQTGANITGLGATYEAVYVFSLSSIHRLIGIDDPENTELISIYDDVGSASQVLSRGNSIYFIDPGEGPMKLDIGGNIEGTGIKLRDWWRDNVNKDMLPFLPIVSDDEENYIYFFVATGTRPYADKVMVFDATVNQWSVWSTHGVSAAGLIQNQFGKRKAVYGTVTGDIFQYGERADTSLGVYTGTLTGNPTTISGNTMIDTAATFDATETPGAAIILENSSGTIIYEGYIKSRVSATTLRVHPSFPAAASTGDTYMLGGIYSYWRTKEDNLDSPHGIKILKWLDVTYEIQTVGSLSVKYRLDGGSWTSLTAIDMTGDGAARRPLRGRCHHLEIEIGGNNPGRPWSVTSLVVEGMSLERTR